jgi:hypothetical protein
MATNILEVPPAHPGNGAVRRVDPLEDAEWDRQLKAVPSASFFHGSAWARVLCDTYGFRPVYFTLGDRDGLQALLPMMEVSSWLTGKRGLCLPFTDECEPICPETASFQKLVRAALDTAKEQKWRHIEYRGAQSLFGDAPAFASFHGHRLDLRRKEPDLWARISSPARRAVKKAEHSGLTVECSQDLAAVQSFYRLLCQTRSRHGVPPQPFRFFSNIHRHVLSQNQGMVVLVRMGKRPVAGAVFFHFGRTAIFKYGASDISFHSLRTNNLVLWQAIKKYAREGFATLDFGRTSLSNRGLRRFKLSWGAEERLINYFKFNRRPGSFVAAQDEFWEWHSSIFKLLPTGVARLIGMALYKHIA